MRYRAWNDHLIDSVLSQMKSAYQNNDINEFELIIKQNPNIMEDTFIREHIEGNAVELQFHFNRLDNHQTHVDFFRPPT